MGTKLEFPWDGMPYISEPALGDSTDIERLSPVNPHRDGRLPLFLKSLQLIEKEIDKKVSISNSVRGPLTVADYLRGTETFLKDLYKNRI